MNEAGFIMAAYGAVGIGLGVYVGSLWLRAARAREASLRIRRDAGAARTGWPAAGSPGPRES